MNAKKELRSFRRADADKLAEEARAKMKPEKEYIYKCINKKRCTTAERGEYALAMSPSEIRAATGRAVRCPSCGELVRYVREQETK